MASAEPIPFTIKSAVGAVEYYILVGQTIQNVTGDHDLTFIIIALSSVSDTNFVSKKVFVDNLRVTPTNVYFISDNVEYTFSTERLRFGIPARYWLTLADSLRFYFKYSPQTVPEIAEIVAKLNADSIRQAGDRPANQLVFSQE